LGALGAQSRQDLWGIGLEGVSLAAVGWHANKICGKTADAMPVAGPPQGG
jgi:hypothetical protein